MIDTIPLKTRFMSSKLLWVHNNPKVSKFLRAVLDCVYHGIFVKTDILTMWYISEKKTTQKTIQFQTCHLGKFKKK